LNTGPTQEASVVSALSLLLQEEEEEEEGSRAVVQRSSLSLFLSIDAV